MLCMQSLKNKWVLNYRCEHILDDINDKSCHQICVLLPACATVVQSKCNGTRVGSSRFHYSISTTTSFTITLCVECRGRQLPIHLRTMHNVLILWRFVQCIPPPDPPTSFPLAYVKDLLRASCQCQCQSTP